MDHVPRAGPVIRALDEDGLSVLVLLALVALVEQFVLGEDGDRLRLGLRLQLGSRGVGSQVLDFGRDGLDLDRLLGSRLGIGTIARGKVAHYAASGGSVTATLLPHWFARIRSLTS